MSNEGPLAGLRVVELATWFYVPGCAAILATHGADVVKIEPAGSADPVRVNRNAGTASSPSFEMVNNRKRSIQLNLQSEAALEVLERLIEQADVFITNVRGKALERIRMDGPAVTKRHPRVVYAHGTGYGPVGPLADAPAFDNVAYWARGGIAEVLRTDDEPPVQLVGAMGDLPTSVALAAGILMALLRREREGRGAIVDASLYGAGLWANGAAIAGALAGTPPQRGRGRLFRANPLSTVYRCLDDRWVQFLMGQTDRYWQPVCEALGRPDLVTDERFTTHEQRLMNHIAGITELQSTIGKMTLAEVEAAMAGLDAPWAPVFDAVQAANDEQARLNEYIVEKRDLAGEPVRTIAPPFRLRGEALQMGPAPAVGQHLEEVLLEIGYDWAGIEALRARQAF
jgi:crotonobetainyl-CoA:carnitine CoA-transferase CaiB-like acyl-CoA transferase